MRIFSNVLLCSSEVNNLLRNKYLYTGRHSLNYYLYLIRNTEPVLEIQTCSPIKLLEKDRKYYCYDQFLRDVRPEGYGNICSLSYLHNKESQFGEELWMYYPAGAEPGDIILVNESNTGEYKRDIIGLPSASKLI